MFSNWRQKRSKKRAAPARKSHTSTVIAQLEELESRWLFAVWTGMGGNNNWTTGANWAAGVPPMPGDDLEFPGDALRLMNTNDFPADTLFNSITFSGPGGVAGYTLGGSRIALGPEGILHTSFRFDTRINFDINLSGTRTIMVASGVLTLAGVLGGPGGVTKTGLSVLSFQGSAANTYQGPTVINEGTLELRKARNVTAVAGPLTVGDGVGFFPPDRVNVADGEQIADDAAVTIRSSGTLDLTGFYAGSFTETLGSLTLTGGTVGAGGDNVLRLAGNVNATSAGITSPATIFGTLDLGAATRTFTVLDGAAPDDLILSARVSGGPGAGLTKAGPGTLTFSGFNDNTYSGTTRVNEGTLFVGGPFGSRAIPGSLIIGDDVGVQGEDRVRLGRADAIADNAPVTVNSSGQLEFQGMYSSSFSDTIGSLTMTGGIVNTRDGTLRLNGNVTAGRVGGRVSSISGNLSLGAATRTFNVTGDIFAADVSIFGTISGEGAAGLIKTGPGTLVMAGSSPNTYTGTTRVREGLLELSKSNAATAIQGPLVIDEFVRLTAGDQIADEAPVSLTSAGALELYGASFSDTIGSLTMTGGAIVTGANTLRLAGDVTSIPPARGQAVILGNLDLGASARTFTVGRGLGIIDMIVGAAIHGSGGMVKEGPGVLALGGTNPLRGGTDVNAGTLLVNGVHTTSEIFVRRSAVLGGTGTVGPFSASGGGIVNPGLNGPGILRTTGVGFFAGGVLRVELNGTTPGTGYDQIVASANVNGAGGRLEVVLNFTPAQGDRFRIIQTTNSMPTPFDGLPNNAVFAVNGLAFRISYDNQGVELVRVQATTATEVVSLDNPSVYGQPVTFLATVSSNVTGTAQPRGVVQFLDGATVLGSAPVNAAGEATFTTRTPLPVGARMIRARYQGSTDFEASLSAPLSQVVQRAATVTSAPISFSNPSVFGQAVTFLAIVNVEAPGAGAPAGMMTFSLGDVVLGSAPVVSGFAVFTATGLPVGTHAVTAEYSGDANFTGSTSAASGQTVNPAPTRTLILSSENPSLVGQRLTFTALTAVEAPGTGTPTGTVTFYLNDQVLATVPVDENGVATLQTADVPEGDHFIIAVYDGDGNYEVSLGYLIQSVVSGGAPGPAGGPDKVLGAPDAVTVLQPGRTVAPTPAEAGPRQGILERLVVRYHQTYQGRTPEQAEITDWLERLRRGAVEEDVIAALIGLGDDALRV